MVVATAVFIMLMMMLMVVVVATAVFIMLMMMLMVMMVTAAAVLAMLMMMMLLFQLCHFSSQRGISLHSSRELLTGELVPGSGDDGSIGIVLP